MDRAVIWAVNRYPSAPLRGCINDALDVAKELHNHGFDDSEITLITDARATKARIISTLKQTIAMLRPGDRFFGQNSSHGVQIPALNDKTEVDGLDECLCPVDFDWTPETTITDDELHEIFSRIPVGVQAVWIADSCHSGTLDRDMPRHTPRVFPVGEDQHDIRWALEAAAKKPKRKKLLAKAAERLPIAIISGCRSDQTSADANFNGRPNGALTYFFLQQLKKEPGSSLRQLVSHVRDALAAAGYEQRPELIGPVDITDKPFFAGVGK